MELSRWQKRLTKLTERRRTSIKLLQVEKANLIRTDDQVFHCEQAQQIVQQVAQTIQQKAHDKIASVVSRCLEAIFDDPYEFKIHFERKRGRTEARLVFVRNGEELTPLLGSGGGVIDVSSFALRVGVLLLSRPSQRPFLVLDEPFKHLKPAEFYGPRIIAMIKSLTADFSIQFIMVQNLKEFQCGKLIRISR